ncbi:unnamed protein product [Owenia fusiformis]|uniref:G-protein coupled receptors family 1 profile domain-containing protein n=1 Tax=Owenia fusiformis TaxID=6347 RepID=A0A8S4PUH4_OWEFU|nr:unnamed protein product [Owenia fusiformis]
MVFFVNYTLTDFSAWLVAIVVLERLVSVLKPHRVKVIITRNRIVITIVVIFVLLMVVNCHFLWTFSINADEVHMFSCQVQDIRYKHFVIYIFPWLDFTAFFLLPVSIVVCCNMVIATKVVHAEIQRKRLYATGSTTSGYKLTSMTVMMVAVSIFLAIATLPSIIYWFLEPTVASDDRDGQSSLLLLLTMSVISVYTNSAINFWMYSVCGSRFRQQLLIFIRCKHRIHPQPALPGNSGITLNSSINNAPPEQNNKNEHVENPKPRPVHVARPNSTMTYHS